MKKHPPGISIKRARASRKEPTEAEKRMKRLLKECFPEARFRFQVPLRHYIADFASHRLKVVIEIDGGQHSLETMRYERLRSKRKATALFASGTMKCWKTARGA